MSGIAGKVCLIAGASQGMGRVTALAAGRAGAKVIAASRRLDVCEAVVKEIRDAGGEAVAMAFDAADPSSISSLLAQVDQKFGKLDLAFNNVGKQQGQALLHEIPLERWERAVAVNLACTFHLMRHEIPLLLKAGGGVIVNNSSAAGLRGVKTMTDYAAVKWGVIGLTKSAALDYADKNIRVNVIAPGVIETEGLAALQTANPALVQSIRDRIPGGSFGSMEDVADLVLWLMSDQARYINGAVIPIDGASTAG
jgi:NAD(P)-dependent dehydrogenase (short-subunit alcohol dehydrogenase family)